MRFTLLELLVVIAIIGILASLLLPSLSQARTKAYAAVSVSQMKQIGLAFQIYASNNNGQLPTSRYPNGTKSAWPNFVRETLALPSDSKLLVHPGAGFKDNVVRTYAITQAMMGINDSGHSNDRISRYQDSIEEPSKTHILTESKLQSNSYGKWRITWNQVSGDLNKTSPTDTKYLDFPYAFKHHLMNADFSIISRHFKSRGLITEPNWRGSGY